MDFLLFLHMGNDAMQTPDDLANALGRVAWNIRDQQISTGTANLTDTNGNTVGFYNFKEAGGDQG